MERRADAPSGTRASARVAGSSFVPTGAPSAARRVNFKEHPCQPRAAEDTLSRASKPRGDSPAKAAVGFSFSRVQAAGGAQGSLGSEKDYGGYAAPQTTSSVSRAFSFGPRYNAQETDFIIPSNARGRGSSSTERFQSTTSLSAESKGERPVGTASVRMAPDSLREDDVESCKHGKYARDWQEGEEEEEEEVDEEGAYDVTAGALWRKHAAQTSTHYPICSRSARERCAYTTSDDWAIFALHSQYVRPVRDREWVPGEPCIIRRDSFELPPGACPYSESTCGLPATAFNSFVFPNPPRQFLMSGRGISSNIEVATSSACSRAGRGRGLGGRFPQLTQQQLLDLERMLWFDPEPRLERPFRLYADSKACLKVFLAKYRIVEDIPASIKEQNNFSFSFFGRRLLQ